VSVSDTVTTLDLLLLCISKSVCADSVIQLIQLLKLELNTMAGNGASDRGRGRRRVRFLCIVCDHTCGVDTIHAVTNGLK